MTWRDNCTWSRVYGSSSTWYADKCVKTCAHVLILSQSWFHLRTNPAKWGAFVRQGLISGGSHNGWAFEDGVCTRFQESSSASLVSQNVRSFDMFLLSCVPHWLPYWDRLEPSGTRSPDRLFLLQAFCLVFVDSDKKKKVINEGRRVQNLFISG